jgi:protoporphyrin/coproporphyrin ferrochelatase
LEEPYQALLVLSFGGPEGPDDVMPFLANVLRGRNVPEARMREVAGHYLEFGGISPINGQNRALVAALQHELRAHGVALPVYWGNRNWHPLLPATLRTMVTDGMRRALVFATAAYGSYSGCRQYAEDLRRAQTEVGADAPALDLLPLFFDHPGFVSANVERLRATLLALPEAERANVPLVFTAHSIPLSMANASPYEEQLRATCARVAAAVSRSDWTLVYQSRSGPPSQPWLEPDIGAYLRALHAQGRRRVVVVPIGFVSDHMEVVYDLDTEAQHLARELGLELLRAGTVGTHPAFVSMVREQVQAALTGAPQLRRCAPECCPGARP